LREGAPVAQQGANEKGNVPHFATRVILLQRFEAPFATAIPAA
jgi:hypothetical protein